MLLKFLKKKTNLRAWQLPKSQAEIELPVKKMFTRRAEYFPYY